MPACLTFTAKRIRRSPSLNPISVPLRLQATWSRSVGVTTKWMTAFLWQLWTGRSYRARLLTPPSCRRPLHAAPDPEQTRSSSVWWQRLSMSSCSSGLRLRSRLAAGWTSGCSWGASWPPANARPPSFPKSTTSSLNRGAPPTRLASVLLLPPPSPPLIVLKRRDTSTCPLWMSPWPRISARPRLSDGRRERVTHQCVRVDNGYDKTRLFTPIRSKTTTVVPQCAARTLKSCAQRWWICW